MKSIGTVDDSVIHALKMSEISPTSKLIITEN